MKNKELFEKTINILVKAFQKETLEHYSCAACAVGNLILASNNSSPVKEKNGTLNWNHDVPYSKGGTNWYGVVAFSHKPTKHLDEINKTGYNWLELQQIEKSFESVKNDKDGYLGLMAVVDCLMMIHEANIEEANLAKSLFVKETV